MTFEQGQSQEQEPTFETIGFNDGGTALQWSREGDVLDVSESSPQKYLRRLGHYDLAILKTRSGNSYGLGKHVVINGKTGQVFAAPAEFPTITLGAPLEIPGVGGTSEIDSLTVKYKNGDVAGVDRQLDTPSPFPALEQSIERARDMLE